jgi:hypothetical protein
MAEFSNIDERVNTEFSKQAPTAKSESPAVVEVVLPKPDDLIAQNNALRAEVEELKRAGTAAKAASEDKESDLRIKVAQAIAHKPVPAVRSNVQQDLAFSKLRDKLGGNCYLKNLTPVQQLEGIGITGSEQVKNDEVKTYFGKTSNGAKANALRRSSPERYSLLRAVAISRGIL